MPFRPAKKPKRVLTKQLPAWAYPRLAPLDRQRLKEIAKERAAYWAYREKLDAQRYAERRQARA